MAKKAPAFNDIDYSLIHDNFYDVDKEFFMSNKPLAKRLSSGFIDYDWIRDDKEFVERSVRYITRTAYTLFTFITQETVPAIALDVKDHNAYCDLINNKLHIGLKSLLNKKVPAQVKVDSIVATIYHEMYHKRYTIPGLRQMIGLPEKAPYYKNPDVEKWVKAFLVDDTFKSLLNILEDRRIEANGAYDFPGFSFYFEESRKYAFYLHSGKKILPPYEVYILDFLMMKFLLPELMPKFKATFVHGLKVLKDYKGIKQMSEDEFNKNVETHERVSELFEQMETYVDSHPGICYSDKFEDIVTATKTLYDMIPKDLKDSINTAISKGDIKGFIRLTELAGGKSFTDAEGMDLPDDVLKGLDAIISDELEKIEKEAEDALKNQERKIHTEKIKSKDKNIGYEDFEIIEEPAGVIDTMLYAEAKKISKNICNNLGFLDSRFVRDTSTFELSEGEMDEDELYSISFNNRNIFQDVEDIPSYALDFGILLDESGSMSGRIQEAKLAVLSMLLGLKDNKHINLFVYGHTANHGNSKAIQIYKYFNTLQRCTDYRKLFTAKARSNNADGYAIDKVADIMKESKAREKILIVVSDGQPSAYGYGGQSGEDHVREVVDRLEQEGITVIQVCMAYIENSGKMFKHYVPFEKDGVFFDNLKKILLTKLNQFADSI